MTAPYKDRRRFDRHAHRMAIQLVVADHPITARLANISFGGLRLQVDPEDLDDVLTGIEAVRFEGGEPLTIQVAWGLYDGTIGATFTNLVAARPIVARILTEHSYYAKAG